MAPILRRVLAFIVLGESKELQLCIWQGSSGKTNILRNRVQSALKTGDHNPKGELPRYWMPFSVLWQREGWLFTHTWWGRDTVSFVPEVSYISLLTCGLKLVFSTLNLQGHHSFVNFPECCLCWHRCNWSWQSTLCASTSLPVLHY